MERKEKKKKKKKKKKKTKMKHRKKHQCFLLDGTLALGSKISYVNSTASLLRWWFLLLVLASVQE